MSSTLESNKSAFKEATTNEAQLSREITKIELEIENLNSQITNIEDQSSQKSSKKSELKKAHTVLSTSMGKNDESLKDL